jgi:hypothetical protein
MAEPDVYPHQRYQQHQQQQNLHQYNHNQQSLSSSSPEIGLYSHEYGYQHIQLGPSSAMYGEDQVPMSVQLPIFSMPMSSAVEGGQLSAGPIQEGLEGQWQVERGTKRARSESADASGEDQDQNGVEGDEGKMENAVDV